MEEGQNIPPVHPLFKSNRKAYVDSVLNANKHLEWVQRLLQPYQQSIQVQGLPGHSTHLMSDDGNGYVFPQIIKSNGKLVNLGDNAENYARANNSGIQLPKVEGTWFADNGYKTGTGVNNSISPQGVPFNNPHYVIEK